MDISIEKEQEQLQRTWANQYKKIKGKITEEVNTVKNLGSIIYSNGSSSKENFKKKRLEMASSAMTKLNPICKRNNSFPDKSNYTGDIHFFFLSFFYMGVRVGRSQQRKNSKLRRLNTNAVGEFCANI